MSESESESDSSELGVLCIAEFADLMSTKSPTEASGRGEGPSEEEREPVSEGVV